MPPTTTQPSTPPQTATPAPQFGNYSNWAQGEISKGANPQDVYNYLQSSGKLNSNQSQPNFFEKLLPTLGGIGGGIIGSLGDVVSGPVGTIGGAAAGGALGQKLENSLTGNKGSTLAAGAENALGMGVGSALGKAGSLLAGKVIAPIAEKGATKLVAGQAPGVTKDLAEYLVKDNGLTDLNKAGQMADMLTGSSSNEQGAVLNKFVEDTLQNQGPQKVQVSDLSMSPLTGRNAAMGENIANETNTLQKHITDNSLSGTPQANAIRSKMTGIFNGLETDASGNTDPMSALNAQRQVSQLASDARDDSIASNRDATMMNVSKTYQSISNELKSRLKLDNIPVSDEDKEALAKDIETYGGSISKQAAGNVASEIRNTPGLTLGGVRNLESNWVQVKTALQTAADQANKNFGASAGDMARSTLPLAGAGIGIGGPKSLLGTIGGLATSSPAADKTGASLLNNVANTAKGKLIQKILPIATRAATISAANLPNIAEGGAAPANNVSSPTGATMTPTSPMGATTSPIEQIFQQLMQQEQAAPASFASSLGPALASLAPTVQKQELGANVASNLEPAYAGAGGAGGLGSGLLSRLSALLPGTSANEYQRQQQSTASILAQILGITPQAAMQLTPQLMQGSGAAGISSGNVNSILGGLGVPTQ